MIDIKRYIQCLERFYNSVPLLMNFFQPTMKLLDQTRNGARVHMVYEAYQRLLKSGVLSESGRAEMAATYGGLNPMQLLKQINSNLV